MVQIYLKKGLCEQPILVIFPTESALKPFTDQLESIRQKDDRSFPRQWVVDQT